MRAGFLSHARLEMAEAAIFYESQQPGLGQRFLDAIDRAVEEINEHPTTWPILQRNIRRRLVGRFPYSVLYRIDRDEIVIVAVMHLHRRPNYWTKRSK